MADNQTEDIGKYARHPVRTAGMAFLTGAAAGAAIMASKKNKEKNVIDKLMDRISK